MSNFDRISRSVTTAPLLMLRLPALVVERLRAMRETGLSGEARRALVEDVRGFAKAAAGFALNNERLLMAGQIERAKSIQRLRALAEEVAAEAIEEEASREAAREVQLAERRRTQAAMEHAARTSEITAETARQRELAEARAAEARNRARRKASGQRMIVDAEEERAREDAAAVLQVAAVEEAAAEDARDEAVELEIVRRNTR